MKLLTSMTTPYGRLDRIVILEHNLTVEIVPIMPWQEREKLVGHNPLSKVPILLLDDDTPIIESQLIANYLDTLGATSLYPANPLERLHMESNCALCRGVAEAAGTILPPRLFFKEKLPITSNNYFCIKHATD